MTLKEIRDLSMPKEKREEEKENLFASYVIRPLSYILTKPFVETRITPNQVSCISLVFAIIGFVIMLLSSSTLFEVIGFFMFILWGILDCVDGNIARIRKQFSPIGKLWDAAAGYAAMSLMYFSIGICAFDAKNPNTVVFVIMGGLSALFCLYPRLLMHFKYSGEEKNELNDKISFNIIKNIVFNITSPDCLCQIIMLIAIITNTEWICTIVYFFLYGAIAFVSSYSLLSHE